jgi:hypothetical protein
MSAHLHRTDRPEPFPVGTTLVHPSNPKATLFFPPRRVAIALRDTTPTVITPQSLSQQFNNIGLKCPASQPDKLEPLIREVRNTFRSSVNDSFLIDQLDQDPYGPIVRFKSARKSDYLQTVANDVFSSIASGPFGPEPSALEVATDLAIVADNFDFLAENFNLFTGVTSNPPAYREQQTATEAFRTLYVNLGNVTASTVIGNLDRLSLEAALSNIIVPGDPLNSQDYDTTNNRFIAFVNNYNVTTQDAAAFGFVYVEWHFVVKDFKRMHGIDGGPELPEKDYYHNTYLNIAARAITYSNVETLQNHVNFVIHTRAPRVSHLLEITPKYEFKVFNNLPHPGPEAFHSGVPLVGSTTRVTSIVFYGANTVLIGSHDNIDSKASTSYTITTTTGFTFAMTQQISQETKVKAGVVFAKAGFKVTMSISISQEWNTTHSESFGFSVPSGDKAFAFQGTVLTRQLHFFPSTNEYQWGTDGKFNTNHLFTNRTPLLGDTVYL